MTNKVLKAIGLLWVRHLEDVNTNAPFFIRVETALDRVKAAEVALKEARKTLATEKDFAERRIAALWSEEEIKSAKRIESET